MKSIIIPGVYAKETGNFFVNSIAKYIRDNNYPNWCHPWGTLVGEKESFDYIISRDDSHVDSMKEFIALSPKDYDTSSGVIYQVDYRDFIMLIDGHYYWATT